MDHDVVNDSGTAGAHDVVRGNVDRTTVGSAACDVFHALPLLSAVDLRRATPRPSGRRRGAGDSRWAGAIRTAVKRARRRAANARWAGTSGTAAPCRERPLGGDERHRGAVPRT